MDDLSLAADFPQATREQWLERVEGVLKGADFARKLIGRTRDGIEIQPLYPKAEGVVQVEREQPGRWRVSQRMDHPDPAQANELALLDLEGGADALTLVSRKAPAARGFGVRTDTAEELDRVLSGIRLDLVHLRLDAGGRGRVAAERVVELAEKRGHELSDLSLDLGMDPIGSLAALGHLSVGWGEASARMGAMLARLHEKGFSGRAFLADGRAYHEAGASEAQELAAVLATGVAYLRALEAQGHSLEAGRDRLSFLLVADADEFLTIAKFRALRRLWARVERACGLEPRAIRLHAETAWRMTTKRDPWVNMLRATVAAFSAGVGGADAITVLPFTAALGLPDAFARRVARNTQLILLEEANLWRVADPAAGAGGFEALTDALCERAWSRFQEIEREGGIIESLKQAALQNRIAAVRAEREKAIATRKEPITGTSEFPNIREADVAVLLPAAAAAVEEPGPAAVTVTPLPSLRTAEPFERLRDLSDACLARTGTRPRVFLANLGPVSAFTARATFAKNFFEAAGIEAMTNEGFSDAEKLKMAFVESKAKLSCICSSDEIYETHAIETAKTLRDAGSAPIYLAGRPGEREEQLTGAGITTFIYAGCDTLKVLSEALEEACS
ncbi:methylmalonyl-CoA mutase family protein [Microvirga makkahensis]|uniref:Methylmalonyl-CoA mutase n=1 Tax=Microvirga makkahensis TaxID=1128670 RepID=A0A7X3SRD5_9HYPH|nr:methylmalonyl-CoA mutase family protein [Microvirga makkahensis]MXQ14511.1 methylmalonyl-CoA mutase [Microvirga makkahensis]